MLYNIAAICVLIMGQSYAASTPEILHRVVKEITQKGDIKLPNEIVEKIEGYIIPHCKVDWKEQVPLLEQKQLVFDDQEKQVNVQSPRRKWTYAVDPNNNMRIILNSLTNPQSLSLSFNTDKYNALDKTRPCAFFSPDETMIGVTIKNKETGKPKCLVYKISDLKNEDPQPIGNYTLDIDAGNHPYPFACKFNKENKFCAIASQHYVDIYDINTGIYNRIFVEPNNMEFSHNGNHLIISNGNTDQTIIYDPFTKEKHSLNEQYLTTIDQDTIITRRVMLTKAHVISHNLTDNEESIVDCKGTDIATMYGDRHVITNPSNSVQIVHFTNPHSDGNDNRYYLLRKNQINEITNKRFKNKYLSNCCLLSDNGYYIALNDDNHINMYHINNETSELKHLASHTNKVPNSQLMHINWNGQNISLLDKKSHTLYTYGYNTNRGFTGMIPAVERQSHTIAQGKIFWNGQILNQNQISSMSKNDRKRGIAHIIDLVQPLILKAPGTTSNDYKTIITNSNAEYAISSLNTKL